VLIDGRNRKGPQSQRRLSYVASSLERGASCRGVLIDEEGRLAKVIFFIFFDSGTGINKLSFGKVHNSCSDLVNQTFFKLM
jgi:hypothetical protein